MKRYTQLLFSLLLFFSIQAKAVCPLCTIVVGAGVGLLHMVGIDDTISGVWIGGLIVSLSIWTLAAMDKRAITFKGKRLTIPASYYLMTLLPLYPMGILGNPLNTLWGVDKLLLGVVVGSAFFLSATHWYTYLKKSNHGHAYFPFQKVVMPIGALIIPSIVFYLITQ